MADVYLINVTTTRWCIYTFYICCINESRQLVNSCTQMQKAAFTTIFYFRPCELNGSNMSDLSLVHKLVTGSAYLKSANSSRTSMVPVVSYEFPHETLFPGTQCLKPQTSAGSFNHSLSNLAATHRHYLVGVEAFLSSEVLIGMFVFVTTYAVGTEQPDRTTK